MGMEQSKVTRLHVAYRANNASQSEESESLPATAKNFLAVQIVNRFKGNQGEGTSNDQ